MAFVVQLAALGQADGELDPGPLEVQVEGDQGEALLIEGHPQFFDLAPVGQQFAHSQGLVVEVGPGMGVGGDVHVVELQLPLADQAEAVAQVAVARPDRLHLRAQQFNARFQGFEDLVLVAGETVVGQQLVGGIPLRLSPFPAGPFRHTAFPFIWVCEGYRRGSGPFLLQIRKGVW